jgi:superfamily II DNA or RNA helicase
MGARCIIFTDRKMLTRQTGERFAAAGIQFGYVSATLGMETNHNVTVASLQTMRSRLSRDKMALPHADVLIIDEAHKTGFDWIVNEYKKANPGVIIIGFTATPVGLKDKYDKLVTAGTKAEGREYGALVPCRVIGMPEPDMRGVKMNKVGEYVHKGMVKRVMQCTVFADIFDQWEKSGSDRPTLVWAPGVPESRSVVEEFRKRGITAEHIDGETEDDDRKRIREGSLCGSVRIVSSFGVMREGVDWPWISYGILVQVCGAYETFVQLVGRILRSSPGKTDAILQDHSGTWWRHGSPNDDRSWLLADTNTKIQKERAEALSKSVADGGDPEPICCPQCHGLRMSGTKCPHCGYEHSKSVRMIRSEGGDLVAMEGDVFPKKKQRSAMNKRWAATLFRAGSTGMTFAQAAAMHMRETGVWAPNNKECHPIRGPLTDDWNRPVRDVYPGFNRRVARS